MCTYAQYSCVRTAHALINEFLRDWRLSYGGAMACSAVSQAEMKQTITGSAHSTARHACAGGWGKGRVVGEGCWRNICGPYIKTKFARQVIWWETCRTRTQGGSASSSPRRNIQHQGEHQSIPAEQTTGKLINKTRWAQTELMEADRFKEQNNSR